MKYLLIPAVAALLLAAGPDAAAQSKKSQATTPDKAYKTEFNPAIINDELQDQPRPLIQDGRQERDLDYNEPDQPIVPYSYPVQDEEMKAPADTAGERIQDYVPLPEGSSQMQSPAPEAKPKQK